MSRAALVGASHNLTTNLRPAGNVRPGLRRRRRRVGPPYPIIDFAVGRAVAGQKDAVVLPPNWSKDRAVPPVLFNHGNLGDRDSFLLDVSWPFVLAVLAYGLPAILCDGDGAPAFTGSAYFNDASQANILTTVDVLSDYIGCDPYHFVAFGTSMGSGVTFNLHKNNPTRVLASAHALVTTSEQGAYNASAGGADGGVHKADVDQAYSDIAGGWATAAPTHDPGQFTAQLTGLPIWLGDHTDDPKNGGQSGVDQLAAAIGGTAVDGPHYYGTGGHTLAGITPTDPAAFLFAHSGLAA